MKLHGLSMTPLGVWTIAFREMLQTETAVGECVHSDWGGGKDETPAPKRVLLADDDLFFRAIVKKVVSSVGHEVDTASDGEEAWEALHATRYDLLVTDHSMPRLTGLSLILRLRAESPSPPCILISASLPLPEPELRRLVHPGVAFEKQFLRSRLVEAMRDLMSDDSPPAVTA